MSKPSSMTTSYALFLIFIITLSISFHLSQPSPQQPPATVCIIGSGIGGSSVAHFLRKYSSLYTTKPESLPPVGQIHLFERNNVVGGRMSTVTVGGEIFEGGAAVFHPKNYHVDNFTSMLELKRKIDDGPMTMSNSLGIWDGRKFVFKTISVGGDDEIWSKVPFVDKIVKQLNELKLLWRYGASLVTMKSFVQNNLNKFMRYYDSVDSKPVFESVEEMLNWSGLYNLTDRTLNDELLEAGLSPLLVNELVTVMTRANYGQSVTIMSGLAGTVSLAAGTGDGLWSIEGGNWQIAKGLIQNSDVNLHLNEEIITISRIGKFYELDSINGNSYACEVVVVATPLDEVTIEFDPPVMSVLPDRRLEHTFATFIRGELNPAYFGLRDGAKIPRVVGTVEEDPDIPFLSISMLKKHAEGDATYKMFSRLPMDDQLLDQIFRVRVETVGIEWAAYPHYNAPESFAPFILDDHKLYYVNAFESAASTMETSAVAAENIARLILSNL